MERLADEPQEYQNNHKISALSAALSLGLMFSPSHAGQNTKAPQAATTQAASDTLSAKQQTISLIAAFMATSDMPRLNAALHQGLDAGLTISEARKILVPRPYRARPLGKRRRRTA